MTASIPEVPVYIYIPIDLSMKCRIGTKSQRLYTNVFGVQRVQLDCMVKMMSIATGIILLSCLRALRYVYFRFGNRYLGLLFSASLYSINVRILNILTPKLLVKPLRFRFYFVYQLRYT